MEIAAPQPAPPLAPSDQDVLCPLCGYNLRGLAEARCPECGASYQWDDLTDPAKRRHPYLFEHHPERNIRSFISTVIGGIRPRRFWLTLHPAQTYRPRRLLIYWLLCVIGFVTIPVSQYLLDMVTLRRNMLEQRASQIAYFKGPGAGTTTATSRPWLRFVATKTQLEDARRQFGSVDRYIDEYSPQPTFAALLERTPLPIPEAIKSAGLATGNLSVGFAFLLACSLIIWPWLATLFLMLLRTTMRQASVRPIHLLRVTIYSADVVLFLAIPLIALAALSFYANLNRMAPSPLPRLLERAADWIIYAPGIALLIITYRFSIAISRYLRFRHALAVAISGQVIFMLLVMKVYVIVCT